VLAQVQAELAQERASIPGAGGGAATTRTTSMLVVQNHLCTTA